MDILQQMAGWVEQQIPSGSWHDKIYSYCERGSDPAFWAEPVNALSNGTFLIAAIAALFLWARSRDKRMIDLVLIALVFVIGIGSFLFHTNASRWSSVADVGPITVFMLAYVAYVLRRFMRLSRTTRKISRSSELPNPPLAESRTGSSQNLATLPSRSI